MSRAEKIGKILGDIWGGIIVLGMCAGGVWLCWNYALVDVIPVSSIEYYKCFLVILGWRCLVYDSRK